MARGLRAAVAVSLLALSSVACQPKTGSTTTPTVPATSVTTRVTVLSTVALPTTTLPVATIPATTAPIVPVDTTPVTAYVPPTTLYVPAVTTPPTVPGNGAMALCNDGTLSYSAHHQGTCSHHGGVAVWYR